MAEIPEFSRLIDVESLPHGGSTFEFEATAEERQNLANRLTLSSITGLTAVIHAVRRGARDSVHY